jgi:hypothetical protein
VQTTQPLCLFEPTCLVLFERGKIFGSLSGNRAEKATAVGSARGLSAMAGSGQDGSESRDFTNLTSYSLRAAT